MRAFARDARTTMASTSSPRSVSPTKRFAGTAFPAATTNFQVDGVRKGNIEHARLLADVDAGKRDFAVHQVALQQLRQDVENAREQLHALTAEHDAIAARLSDAQGAPVGGLRAAERLALIGTLRQSLDVSDKALAVQRKRMKDVDEKLYHKEHEMMEREVALARMIERLVDARAGVATRL